MSEKVCHLTSVHRRYDTRIYEKECGSLARAGYEVVLIVNDENGGETADNGVRIVSTGLSFRSKRDRMTKGSRAVYELALKEDASLYHIHDPELIPYGMKLIKKGYPVIWDSHEEYMSLIDRKEYIPGAMRRPASLAFRTFYRHALRKFSAVVTVTPGQEPLIRDYCKSVTMVTNYPIVDPEASCEHEYDSKKIAFAGGISYQWDHREIIEAIAEDPEVRYVLLGPVVGSNYMEELRALPNWDQVDYLGKIPHSEVADVLRQCSVGMALLKPSNNTFGKQGTIGNTKIFEEMEAGLPVICTDFDLWKEIVSKYSCGIMVDPEDIPGIRAAILKLTSDPELCLEMGQNGRRAILEEYNWGTQEKILLDLYRRVLETAKH
ncbi:MAG: glycosyltransferase [Clostridia bacterium]|nr:glycosyltransferase [Clostridia bacterium]